MSQVVVPPRKLLVVRLSAMGDIVLTTPVLRALATGLPGCEIHLVSKAQFAHVLAHNPHLARIHTYDKQQVPALLRVLRAERYDAVLDLQGSLRSRRLCWALRRPRYGFRKYNLTKWRMVRWKQGGPVPHVVDRYAAVLRPFRLTLDEGGLEYHPGTAAEAEMASVMEAFRAGLPPMVQAPVAVVLGATHATKRWPLAHHAALLNRLGLPAVLLGGPAEVADATALLGMLYVPVLNATGAYDLHRSAALMRLCQFVVTHDTGLMHIAAAFGMRILSIWGNTVPGFGMTPWRTDFQALEVPDLYCRPCSKIGYAKCPEGHFRCMWENTPERAFALLQQAGYLS